MPCLRRIGSASRDAPDRGRGVRVRAEADRRVVTGAGRDDALHRLRLAPDVVAIDLERDLGGRGGKRKQVDPDVVRARRFAECEREPGGMGDDVVAALVHTGVEPVEVVVPGLGLRQRDRLVLHAVVAAQHVHAADHEIPVGAVGGAERICPGLEDRLVRAGIHLDADAHRQPVAACRIAHTRDVGGVRDRRALLRPAHEVGLGFEHFREMEDMLAERDFVEACRLGGCEHGVHVAREDDVVVVVGDHRDVIANASR